MFLFYFWGISQMVGDHNSCECCQFFKLLEIFQNPAIKPKFFYTIKYLCGRFNNGPSKKSIICYYK